MLGCRRDRTDPQRSALNDESKSWAQRCVRRASPRVGCSGSLSCNSLAVAMILATATVAAAQPPPPYICPSASTDRSDFSASTDPSASKSVVVLTAPMHGWVLGTSPTGLAFYATPPCGCLQRVAEGAEGACEWTAERCSITAVVSVDGREGLRVELNGDNNFAYSSGEPYLTQADLKLQTINPKP